MAVIEPSSDGLLPEDHAEIRLVPDGVRDMWRRRSSDDSTLNDRERDSWRAFLATNEGRAWLRERAAAHRNE